MVAWRPLPCVKENIQSGIRYESTGKYKIKNVSSLLYWQTRHCELINVGEISTVLQQRKEEPCRLLINYTVKDTIDIISHLVCYAVGLELFTEPLSAVVCPLCNSA